MRGVTVCPACEAKVRKEFQLTRLMRGVTPKAVLSLCAKTFQLTRLMRGVTCHPNSAIAPKQAFQLTRLMRGVTLPSESLPTVVITISTHTPHARRDSKRQYSISSLY